ncbi:Protein of unknown function [Pseudarcicella hirudinis]|uniref:DUF4197 domain-containing protein n=1 Tax=Pseudarcicella hirudinis TaxID=1079859 RepID=A0A1I5N3K7_9BACT|nr:DUF4197 domain-containing protein [Pseudarcicella hirudinis]SFP16172.1 Protein of unknown function [Pseudarcicella hirudinis]
MKKTLLSISLLILMNSCQAQNLGGILKQAGDVLNQGKGGLSTDEISQGLKEALTVGIKNSSSQASALNGFLGNEAIKLLFPPEAQKVEQKLRQIGLGNECDKFITALNRGAEKASEKAVPIFVDAITKMTIQDALGILKGDKNAATLYLKKTSSAALANAFSPVIEESINSTGATRMYGDIANTYNRLPFVQKVNPDLKNYATQKAIDGLFSLVEKEELKIRENPAARVTDLLKKVFGAQ